MGAAAASAGRTGDTAGPFQDQAERDLDAFGAAKTGENET